MGTCATVIKGINASCDSSMGGVKKVYLLPNDSEFVLATGDTGTNVTGITSATTTAYEFNFKKNTVSMTSTLNVDAANGVNYISTELTMQFTRMETEKRTAIQALAIGQCKAVVVDANGEAWLLGYDEPLEATAGTAQTGQAKTDGNFYSITLTDESVEFPYALTADALKAVEDIVVKA